MANKFRNFSCYGENGRHIEFAGDVTVESKSNSEQIIVDGAVPGAGKGVPTSTAKIDGACSTGGKDSSQRLFDLHASGDYVTYTFGIIDGRILSASMMVETISYTGKASNGTTMFSASLVGGEITKVG